MVPESKLGFELESGRERIPSRGQRGTKVGEERWGADSGLGRLSTPFREMCTVFCPQASVGLGPSLCCSGSGSKLSLRTFGLTRKLISHSAS